MFKEEKGMWKINFEKMVSTPTDQIPPREKVCT
jgi:hypothetical protein